MGFRDFLKSVFGNDDTNSTQERQNLKDESGSRTEESGEIQPLKMEPSDENSGSSELNVKQDDEIQELKKAHEAELENENEKLKGEVEDLEDELKDEIKKLEEKKDEIKKLEEKFKETKSKIDDLTNGNESLRGKLSEKDDEISKKKKSLNLVTHILNADEVTKKNVDLYKHIDELKEYVKEDFKSCITNYFESEYKKEYFEDDLDYWENLQRRSWLNNKKIVAFIGAFSSGKTTIINKLFNLKLPVSLLPQTAIPTYIANGAEGYRFYTPDGKLKTLSCEVFSGIDHESLPKEFNISSLVKHLVVYTRNELLEKYSILDTPGFDANNEDTQSTKDVIKECDAIFWCLTSEDSSMKKGDLSVLGEFQKKYNKPLYILLNVWNGTTENEANAVSNGIANNLKNRNISFKKIIKFSPMNGKYADPEIVLKELKTIEIKNRSNYAEALCEYADRLKTQVDGELQKIKTAVNETDSKVRQEQNNMEKRIADLKSSFSKMEKNFKDVSQLHKKSSEWGFWHHGDLTIPAKNVQEFLDFFKVAPDTIKTLDGNVEKISTSIDLFTKFSMELNEKKNEKDELREKADAISQCVKKLNKLTAPFKSSPLNGRLL